MHLKAKSKFTRLVFVKWNGFGIKMLERLGLSGKGSGVIAQEVELLYLWTVTEGYDGYKRVEYSAVRLLMWAKKLIY